MMDDSAGSDSLDKSLQKKCVVDDVGQGEGAAASSTQPLQQPSSKNAQKTRKAEIYNSTKKLKTENSAGDGGGSSAAVELMLDDNQPSEADSKESCLEPTQQQANHVDANHINCEGNNSAAFETKVTQISENLKDTTLTESQQQVQLASEVTAATSTSSTAAAVSESMPADNAAAADINAAQEEPPPSETGAQSSFDAESADNQDARSKKVRFHPDVKPNDGGKRIVNKKKKLKTSSDDDCIASTSTGARPKRMVEMDVDDEDAEEEQDITEELEEEFDWNKTVAEAKDYLKQHPLMFLHPSASERLQEPKDLPKPEEEETEEEETDFYANVPAENGVERVLGKLSGSGKTMYLMRYEDERGLCWEPEDVIIKLCPTLLDKYEQFREWRQQNLIRYVAKRQRFRQRYTDF